MRMLGTAKCRITPEKPLRLCGFGFRRDVYSAVRKDIFVRVFDIQEEGRRAVLIYADLLWWNTKFVCRMKPVLETRCGVKPDQVLFVASHNHSGPGTGDTFIPLLETEDKEYTRFLEERIVETVREAGMNLEPVAAKKAEGSCNLNVYRRVKTAEGIQMMPNYEIKPDRRLTVLSFYRMDGSLKGRILHYACHANLSKDNELHPDYPGYALEQSDQEYPGSVSMFLQGCTADMRPNCVLGNQFRPGTEEEVQEFARMFYQSVQSALASGETELGAGMKLSYERTELEVEQEFEPGEVTVRLESEEEPVRLWARKILEKNLPKQEILELSLLQLGGQYCYFFNAEMTKSYAEMARKMHPGAISSGYTNGMIGYLCSAEQIQAGGYEPRESAIYFAVAGTYAPSVEQRVEKAMKEIEER